MIQREFLTEALEIDTEKTRVLAIVGGGGKTSLIFRLTEELVSSGKSVIVTTTTHMAYEPERPFALDGDIQKVMQNLEQHGYTVAACLDTEKGKVGSLTDQKLQQLKETADVLLIEADGAKRRPLKVPAQWEPVIPEFTDMVIGVIGLDAFGQPIEKICHREEQTAAFLQKRSGDLITEEDICKIAISEKGLRKSADYRQYRIFLNKTDLPGKADTAAKIAGQLEEHKILTAYGSLYRREYYR